MMNNNRPAGFWPRSLASLIDGALSFLVTLLVAYQVINSSHNVQDFITTFVSYLAFVLFPLGIYHIFHASIFTHLFGGSPGKLITGLAVTDVSGGKLPFKKILFRYLIGYQLSTLAFGLGFLAILRDPERRSWHDKVAGSRVIVRAAIWPVGIIALGALIYGNFLVGTMTIKSFESNTLLKTDASILFSQLHNLDKQKTKGTVTPAFNAKFGPIYGELLGLWAKKDYKGVKARSQELIDAAQSSEEKGKAYSLIGENEYYLTNDKLAHDYSLVALTYLPDDFYANRTMSWITLNDKKMEDAESYANKALENSPSEADKAPIYYILASIHYQQYKDKQATIEINAALVIDPTNATYLKLRDNINKGV